MYQTTLPAKCSPPRRYDPIDESLLVDDLPVVTRDAAGQNQDAPQIEREGEPPGESNVAQPPPVVDVAQPRAAVPQNGEEPGTETAELAFHEAPTTSECAASSKLSYLDLLSTSGLQDTCRQAIAAQTAAAETENPHQFDQPIGETADGDAELDVAVDPLDESVVDGLAPDEEAWVEDGEDEGDTEETGAAGESEIAVTEAALVTTEMRATQAPMENATGEAVEPDLWSAPTVTGKPMPALPPKGAIAALGIPRAAGAPERIGSGRLVAARLTWKPREASFPGAPPRREFRWDTMLTAACVTAACGIGCIWLLRAILA
jgi:hypothetical protein